MTHDDQPLKIHHYKSKIQCNNKDIFSIYIYYNINIIIYIIIYILLYKLLYIYYYIYRSQQSKM